MTEKQKLSPGEALNQLFEVIRDEALGNPSFARRMLSAVGYQVVYTGTEAAGAVDPILVAAAHEYPAFREMFSTFSEKDLKAIMASFALATAEDVKSVKAKGRAKKIAFIDLMWDGAQRKIAERRTK